MYLFKESGRLGNQLFQYSALKTLCGNSKGLALLGFKELQAMCDGIDAVVVNSNSPKRTKTFYSLLYKYTDTWSQKGIFPRVKESKGFPKVIHTPGLFNQITFVEKSYFQSEAFFNPNVLEPLRLKSKLLDQAKKLLHTCSPERAPIFVHIRRGDYLTWPSGESPAVLPAQYYWDCMNYIRADVPKPFWIFTSDDLFYVEDVFGDVEHSYISKGSSLEDFALMTQCQGGILAASSFSWWAAYLSKYWGTGSHFIAPKYWAGHRTNVWFPSLIKSNHLEYVCYKNDFWNLIN
ncbi:alpha-1,2-fucosyltransferase [Nodosilinea sp. AN01ver1]|uniref:alpha-1,2-fucosyltransferase n=1 Tax=Nodosilinea sp. AN01ver1 TaxID=3423362 RepID=UPI003D322E88